MVEVLAMVGMAGRMYVASNRFIAQLTRTVTFEPGALLGDHVVVTVRLPEGSITAWLETNADMAAAVAGEGLLEPRTLAYRDASRAA